MNTNVISLYEAVKKHFGERAAEDLTAFITVSCSNVKERDAEVFATKGDISGLELKMAEMKTEVVRWMFAFMIAVIIAFISLYLKK